MTTRFALLVCAALGLIVATSGQAWAVTEQEPNNGSAQASGPVLSEEKTITDTTGGISGAGDQDWYKFYVLEPTNGLRFAFWSGGSGGTISVQVSDSAGKPVPMTDAIAGGPAKTSPFDIDLSLHEDFPGFQMGGSVGPGKYFIKLTGTAGANYAFGAGSRELGWASLVPYSEVTAACNNAKGGVTKAEKKVKAAKKALAKAKKKKKGKAAAVKKAKKKLKSAQKALKQANTGADPFCSIEA